MKTSRNVFLKLINFLKFWQNKKKRKKYNNYLENEQKSFIPSSNETTHIMKSKEEITHLTYQGNK